MNQANEEINGSEVDLEDMMPGHDDGAGYQSKVGRYEIYKSQAKSVREELRKLGYQKAL